MAYSSTSADEPLGEKFIILSVIMPNYNHSEFISTALEAIFAQSRQPDEVIIIDDGSVDDSRSVIESWASREPKIHTIFNAENIGAIASINRGIQASCGRYVCLMAADDVACPGFFSLALDAFERHPEAALVCGEANLILIDDPKKNYSIRPIIRPSNQLHFFSPAETRSLLRLNDNFIVPLATVFRRDLMLENGGLNTSLGSMADGFLSRHLAVKCGFCFLPEVVVNWRVNPNGLSRVTARASEVILALIDEGRVQIDRDTVFPPGYADLFERRLRFSTCRLALTEEAPDWEFVQRVGSRGWIDQCLFSLAKSLPRIWGVYVALPWLALRLRPYSLLAMAETWVRRRFRKAQ